MKRNPITAKLSGFWLNHQKFQEPNICQPLRIQRSFRCKSAQWRKEYETGIQSLRASTSGKSRRNVSNVIGFFTFLWNFMWSKNRKMKRFIYFSRTSEMMNWGVMQILDSPTHRQNCLKFESVNCWHSQWPLSAMFEYALCFVEWLIAHQ